MKMLQASILIWGIIVIFPIVMIIEQPWNFNPRLDSTISLIYLGIFPTGIAWLLKISNIKKKWFNFSSTSRLFNSNIWSYIKLYIFKRNNYNKSSNFIIAVIVGIYFVRRSIKENLTSA